MSRVSHTALVDITNIAVVIGNYYSRNWNGGLAPAADTGPGAAMTVTASIEFPAGTFTQMKFGGSATGTVPDNDLLVSDLVALAIPKGSQFWDRSYRQCTAGIVTSAGDWRVALGDSTRLGTSGITDQTMSGTVTFNSGIFVPPCALVGNSSAPSVAGIGTSIEAGVGDNTDPGDVRHGFGRSLTTVPFINLAQGGATCAAWISGHPIHQKLLRYCTSMLTDMGENDYDVSDIPTTVAQIQTIYALMPGAAIWQTTMLPRVTSSANGFVSPNDQVGQPSKANQEALNAIIRGAGIPGMTGFCDIDNILEVPNGNGWWSVTTDAHGNAPPFTLDGTHPTQSGQFSIRDNAAINQSLFT